LAACIGEGYEAYLIFVVQMKDVCLVKPNDEMHREFGDALRRAANVGVKLLAVDCKVTPDSITADSPIPVEV
ncbi:MAG: DNA/RNA nuclease SfsA, partial [Clostridia bacterium]|nr:DNA/RNA nuclease SfsA [Clostridia bacterium]